MIFVGIDPGKHGAVAAIDGQRRVLSLADSPLVDGEIDFLALKACFPPDFAIGVPRSIVTMEQVHAMPTDGRCSAFSFGVSYGAWLGVLGALGWRPNLVPPATWKRSLLAGMPSAKDAGKASAMAMAERLFPTAKLRGPRGGALDGKAEALLLAELGRRTWQFTAGRCVHRQAEGAA